MDNIEDFVRKFRDKAEKIHSELETENSVGEGGGNFDLTEVNKFLEIARKPQAKIVVVGAVKAGKSSLLNALFGSDITSVDIIPETACLSVFKASPQNQFKATFYSQDEWDRLWESQSGGTEFSKVYDNLNADSEKHKYVGCAPEERSVGSLEQLKKELVGFTSAKYPAHLFVKELEIGISDYPIDNGIYFVDTPGLNDPVAYRSTLTRDHMHKASAIVVCIGSEAMRTTDIETLGVVVAALRKQTEKLLVVGTKIDNFQKEDDWERQQQVWQKEVRERSMNIEHIVGVSSYIHLICKQIEDGKDFSEEELYDALIDIDRFMRWRNRDLDRETVKARAAEIKDKANIDNLLDILKSGPLKDPIQLIKGKIQEEYDNLCSHYLKDIERNEANLNEQQKLLAASQEEQQAKMDELNKQQDELKTGNDLMQKAMRGNQRKVQDMCEEGKAVIRKKIQGHI